MKCVSQEDEWRLGVKFLVFNAASSPTSLLLPYLFYCLALALHLGARCWVFFCVNPNGREHTPAGIGRGGSGGRELRRDGRKLSSYQYMTMVNRRQHILNSQAHRPIPAGRSS